MKEAWEITQFFEEYNQGLNTPFEFIETVAFHNSTCTDVLKIDCIKHSNVAVYMWQNKIVTIKLS